MTARILSLPSIEFTGVTSFVLKIEHQLVNQLYMYATDLVLTFHRVLKCLVCQMNSFLFAYQTEAGFA